MKIQVIKKADNKIKMAVCPWVIDVPPETNRN
jgi:hypothetical protein